MRRWRKCGSGGRRSAAYAADRILHPADLSAVNQELFPDIYRTGKYLFICHVFDSLIFLKRFNASRYATMIAFVEEP